MARLPGKTSSSRVHRAAETGRRLWPFVLLGWRRWQALTDEEKAHYRAKAKGYAAQGRKAVDDVRKKRPHR